MVRDWAAGSSAIAAIRDVEQGKPDAWRPVFAGLTELGFFGVAVSEDAGGAGGSVGDLCAMLDEAARALVPGPVASTALATLVLDDATLLESLAAGERTAGLALTAELTFEAENNQVSGTADYVVGADSAGVLLLPGGDQWLLADATPDRASAEQLTPA